MISSTFSQIFTSWRQKSCKNLKKWRRFSKEIDFKGIKLPGKIRNIRKTKKKHCINISGFCYYNREKFPMYVSKNNFERYEICWLIIDRRKRPIILFFIKDLNTFKYNQTVHHDRKYFCNYWLQSFTNVEVLKRYVNDCFKINGRQRIKMVKEVKLLNWKAKRKEKGHSWFMLTSQDAMLM